MQGARDPERENGRRGEEEGRLRRSLEWVGESTLEEVDGNKKKRGGFDMYRAFLTGLGVQQDTLGAQNRFFFFGCTGWEYLSNGIRRIWDSILSMHLGVLFSRRVYTDVSAPFGAH